MAFGTFAASLSLLGSITAVCAAIAIVGTLYLLYALAQLLRFQRRARGPARAADDSSNRFRPAVTILKPLCGLDAQLYENLRSFCDQEYESFQIIFGVRDHDDPAIAVVKRVIAEFPNRDLELVVDARVRVVNLKVANLMNMLEHAKHDILAIADADMRVRPEYLTCVVEPFADERVGAVTMLFGAQPVAGFASRLRAMLINDHFIPSVLVRLSVEKPNIGFGSTLAFRRSTLERIGGFDVLGSHLAEDTAFAKRVAELGLEVRVPPYVVQTIAADDARALWDHEMRWMRTIRALAPAGFLGSFVTYPLPFALLVLALSRISWLGAALVALVLTVRILLHYAARRVLQLGRTADVWLIPVRDCLSVASWFASFFGRDVLWRGRAFRINRGDDIALRGR